MIKEQEDKAFNGEHIIFFIVNHDCYSEKFFKIKVFIGIYSKAVKSSHDWTKIAIYLEKKKKSLNGSKMHWTAFDKIYIAVTNWLVNK